MNLSYEATAGGRETGETIELDFGSLVFIGIALSTVLLVYNGYVSKHVSV